MQDEYGHIGSPDLKMGVEEEAGGAVEVWLSRVSDRKLFEQMAALLAKEFKGTWVAKADEADQRNWDMAVRDVVVTLHLKHFVGISLLASSKSPDLEAANKLVLEMAEMVQERVE